MIRAFSWALAPLGVLYGSGVLLRRWAYDRGLLSVVQPPAFTVSVGGLEAGGSGKTPVAGLLLGAFAMAQRSPGLLSRGYGRKTTGLVVRQRGGLADPGILGDEPAMLVAAGHDVPVAACERRSVGAQALVDAGCQTLVLDDGFAHRALGRDVEIVVLNGEAPFGSGHYLPWGSLREPPSSLRRAQVVWLHYRRNADTRRPAWFEQWCPQAVLVVSRAVVDSDNNLKGARAVAAAGIARPAEFRSSLENAGVEVCELVSFADHHVYTAKDVERLRQRQRHHNATVTIVTAKDAVKLAPMWEGSDLWVVASSVQLVQGTADLADALKVAPSVFE